MLRLREQLAVALCAVSLTCCSGESDGGPLGGGLAGSSAAPGSSGSGGFPSVSGSASTLPSAGQTSAGTGSGGSNQASLGGSGSGSSGGAVACSSFADDAAWKLTVHIKNQKSSTIYVGSKDSDCNGTPLFEVQDGGRTVLHQLGTACRAACSTVMESGPVACANACAQPSTLALEPGQTIDVPWDGLFGVDATVPAECMHTAQPSPTSCTRAQQIKNGLFTFSAQAGDARTCSSPSGCTCAPNPSGGCIAQGSTMSGTITTTDLMIALEPGESSVGGDPQYIGLVFKP